MAQLTLEMPESAFGTLHPFTESAEKTAWVFSDGGIRNIPTTTGFSSRVSRHLQGTGRRTSRRVTVFCGRKSRVRFSPSFNTLKFLGIPTLPRPTFKGSTETCALCGPLCGFSEESKAMEIPSSKELHRKPIQKSQTQEEQTPQLSTKRQ